MAIIYKPGKKIKGYTITPDFETNRGAMATSYSAKGPDGRKLFLKCYKTPSPMTSWFKKYMEYQKEVRRRIEGSSCQNFCYRFVDQFTFDDFFFQVFEFLEKSDSMHSLLQKAADRPDHLSPDKRLLIAKAFVGGIKQLHVQKIIHADLKPDNVMMITDKETAAGYRMKIIDMDFALLADMKAPWDGPKDGRGYFGTAGYISPEHTTIPLPASDIFTVGLMLYELFGNRHPYVAAEDYDRVVKAYRAPKPKLSVEYGPAEAVKNVEQAIYACVDPNHRNRPTADNLHKTLLTMTIRGLDPIPVTPPTIIPPKPVLPPSAKAVQTELILKGPAGQPIRCRVDQVIGRRLVKSFGDDYKVYSSDQFRVERDDDGWYVTHCDGALNKTTVNGEELIDRRRLFSGDVVAAGNVVKKIYKMPLVVAFGGDVA